MIIRHTSEAWSDLEFRRSVLREARRDAKAGRTRVVIRVGTQHKGYVTRAIVDGRFYVGRVTRV